MSDSLGRPQPKEFKAILSLLERCLKKCKAIGFSFKKQRLLPGMRNSSLQPKIACGEGCPQGQKRSRDSWNVGVGRSSKRPRGRPREVVRSEAVCS